LQKIVWLQSVRDSATLEEEKSTLHIPVRLLKDEEIKFSADKFLLNKWLFAKINEHFKLI